MKLPLAAEKNNVVKAHLSQRSQHQGLQTLGSASEGMGDSTWSSLPCYHPCYVTPRAAQSAHGCFIGHPTYICSRSVLTHPTCFVRPRISTRCSCLSSCSHFHETTSEALKNLKELLDTTDVPVLARRETDGYYYQGKIIKGIEGEMRKFLVQFARPFAVGEEDTVSVQETDSSDIFECVTGMRHSILPGDKVLAPWEPEQKRYGPGTVLQGMETRDPLREREDEKITISFWNGKKAKVPLGVALWIPPHQWERIVEMIHMPHTTRKKIEGQLHRAKYYAWPHFISPCTYPCTLGDRRRLQWTHCSCICPYSSCFQNTCSQRGYTQYASCCSPKYCNCWWKPPSAELTKDDFSSRPTTQLLAVEGPPKAESALALPVSSSSSSATQTDWKASLTMVDHAVNTDYTLFDKPKVQEVKRPDWKYWKRSHPSSLYKSQGSSVFSSCSRKERTGTKVAPHMDTMPIILLNQSAIFETIEQSPRNKFTVKKVLNQEDIKPSSWGG
uniref:DUF4537 domain-containing protein n=1 Tax=Anolis carolinensis TaxID=28377 RepID=A0A803TI82_ANOCA|nr:PREDICTED: uncharacterized protein C11orf16 homolog [Anolis carolinensis]|eukprot:XP_008105314.1 PREDICTED: uncharacterized protein C11orf16 homolog [Anolis carolinensis]